MQKIIGGEAMGNHILKKITAKKKKKLASGDTDMVIKD